MLEGVSEKRSGSFREAHSMRVPFTYVAQCVGSGESSSETK
jgi:hypothetical protein